MSNALLRQLNPEQAEAVKTIEGPLLVLAGAGTGKTRVITFRIAYMLEQGIPAENILGMTFTNKAAREMKERLEALAGEDAAKVTLGTFHAFCARVLRKEIKALSGYSPSFTIADDSDQKGIIRQAAAELGFPKDLMDPGAVSAFISRAKNNLTAPGQAGKNFDASDFEIRAAQVYRRYQQILENQNMLDFDDMLFFVYRIWDENPKILEAYRNTYRYLLVDEYQDTNLVQFTLLKMLAGEQHNICAVGDDDQSIYGWRGAVAENILDFPQQFPGGKLVKLEQNYRSTTKILNAANQIISGNSNRYQKNLWSELGEGEDLRMVRVPNAEDEAQFVAEAIAEIVIRDTEFSYEDISILYRSNYMSRLLEQALRQARVPYRLVGGQEYFKRKEIKDAVAYLKLLVNPRDDQSLLRILGVPPRGIGDKAVQVLKELQATAFLPLSELLADSFFLEKISKKAASGAEELSNCLKKYRSIFSEPGNLAAQTGDFLEEVGYMNGLLKIYKNRKEAESRQENIYELINAIGQFEKQAKTPPMLMDFIESFALLDDNDKVDEDDNANSITLSTVHASKGLEYPCVFLIGLEQNLFPHRRSLEEGNIDEELRLFYVAVTRAKKRLIISCSNQRMIMGRLSFQRPSEFLQPLCDADLLHQVRPEEFFTTASVDELNAAFADIFASLEED
jgi:superfamily I DNA/RNA helicase